MGFIGQHWEAVVTIAVAVVSVAARYAPNTPFWIAVRSWAVDYAQRNARELPAELTVRIDSASAEVVLLVAGREAARFPMVRLGAAESKALSQAGMKALEAAITSKDGGR